MRLINGHLASAHHVHFGLIDVHTQDFVAGFGQTGPSDQTYISRSYYRNFHELYFFVFKFFFFTAQKYVMPAGFSIVLFLFLVFFGIILLGQKHK